MAKKTDNVYQNQERAQPTHTFYNSVGFFSFVPALLPFPLPLQPPPLIIRRRRRRRAPLLPPPHPQLRWDGTQRRRGGFRPCPPCPRLLRALQGADLAEEGLGLLLLLSLVVSVHGCVVLSLLRGVLRSEGKKHDQQRQNMPHRTAPPPKKNLSRTRPPMSSSRLQYAAAPSRSPRRL